MYTFYGDIRLYSIINMQIARVKSHHIMSVYEIAYFVAYNN